VKTARTFTHSSPRTTHLHERHFHHACAAGFTLRVYANSFYATGEILDIPTTNPTTNHTFVWLWCFVASTASKRWQHWTHINLVFMHTSASSVVICALGRATHRVVVFDVVGRQGGRN
jgi:hypothetical protein